MPKPWEPPTEPTIVSDRATANSARSLRPGDIVGRYTIEGRVGEGGMGTVYRARDTVLGRVVALKTPHVDDWNLPETQQMLERFRREATAAGQLFHPNVCPVYDFGTIDGLVFLTMPLLEGEPLSARLGRDGPLPVALAAELTAKLASGLQCAHDIGIVHRDLKPGNVFLRRSDGEPILMDFGLARTPDSVNITATGRVVGTPSYLAPELLCAKPDQPVTAGPLTDVYGLGLIFYEMLTGRRAFLGETFSVLEQIRFMSPTPPSQYRRDLPTEFEDVCRRAIAKQPSDRFASMRDFAAALTELLSRAGPSPRASGSRWPNTPTPPATGANSSSPSPTVPSAIELNAASDAAEPNVAEPNAAHGSRRRVAIWAVVLIGVLLLGVALGVAVKVGLLSP